nr:hypothetical protein [uncultured Halomonas sp.]
MAKILLKELGMLGIVLGLTMEAPAFAEDEQSEADKPTQQSTTAMQGSGPQASARQGEGDIRKRQDEPEGDTEGGMVKQEKAGFGSGGEAMPGTDLPEPPEQRKGKKE